MTTTTTTAVSVTVVGKDNNQLSGSGRNSVGNCDSVGDDGNGHSDSWDDQDQGADGGGGGGGVYNGGDSDSRGAQRNNHPP